MMRKVLFLLVLAGVLLSVEIETSGVSHIDKRSISKVAEAASQNPSEAIQALFRDEGYLLAKVELTGDSVKIERIFIDAGPRAVISRFEVRGLEYKLPPLKSAVGRPFRRVDLEADMHSLVSELENKGFPFAEAIIESLEISAPNDDELPTEIIISMKHGDFVAVSAVILPEGAKTKPYVVAKTMMINPPEPFSKRRIEAGLRRVDALGFIKVVDEPQLLLDDSGVWVLRVNLSEGKTVIASGVASYSPRGTGKGLSGQLEGTIDNIRGTGRRVSATWSQNSQNQIRFKAAFREPFFLGGFGGLNCSAEYFERGALYSQRAFAIEYRIPLNFVTSTGGGVSYKTVQPNFDGLNRFPKSAEWRFDFSLRREGLWPRINSTGGFDYSLIASPAFARRNGNEPAMTNLAESETVLRFEGGFAIAQALGKGVIAFERIEGRSVLTKGELPQSEQYSLGGWGSLRGYREEQFWSKRIAWSNSELRALLGGDAHIFGFFDVGAIDSYNEEVSVKLGYGLGLRLSTAVGRWTVAYGIGGGESPTDGMIHVGLTSEL